jgi:hypothetical protein
MGCSIFFSFLHVSLLVWAIKENKNCPNHHPRIPQGKIKRKLERQVCVKWRRFSKCPPPRRGIHIRRGAHVFYSEKLYLELDIVEISFVLLKHVNNESILVKGKDRLGDYYTFASHISKKAKTFVIEHIHLKLSASQIMAKHK